VFLASAVEGHGRAQPAGKRRIFLACVVCRALSWYALKTSPSSKPKFGSAATAPFEGADNARFFRQRDAIDIAQRAANVVENCHR
jgi:hypothetical protein